LVVIFLASVRQFLKPAAQVFFNLLRFAVKEVAAVFWGGISLSIVSHFIAHVFAPGLESLAGNFILQPVATRQNAD